MLNLLTIISAIFTGKELVKDHIEKNNPNTHVISDWDAFSKDVCSGVSSDERMRKMRAGLYEKANTYPEPHRDKDGKIRIENSRLFNDDLIKFGAIQTYKWVDQGKYNLTPEQLIEERKRLDREAEERFRVHMKSCKNGWLVNGDRTTGSRVF